MTITPIPARPIANSTGSNQWTTLWIADHVGTDPVQVIVDAYSVNGGDGEVRAFTWSTETATSTVVVDSIVGRYPLNELAATPGRIEVQGRVLNGVGRVVVPRASMLAGQGLAIVAPTAVFIAVATNLATTVGFGITHAPPDHTGDSLFFERLVAGSWLTTPTIVANAQLSDAGQYRWRAVRNADGAEAIAMFDVTVSAAQVTPTVILTNPIDQSVIAGSTASFSAYAQGENLTWQVFVNGALVGGVRTTNNAFNEATVTYDHGPVAESENGSQIRIEFTGADGNTVSTTSATLTVTAVPQNGLLITDIEETWR